MANVIVANQGDDNEQHINAHTVGYTLRQVNDPEEWIAEMLGAFTNVMSQNQVEVGRDLGEAIGRQHRTLQSGIVTLLMETLVGVGQQQYTDPRNEYAVEACKKLGGMIEDGTLLSQYPFI